MRTRRRYETLDALRGVAALAVVVFHLVQVKLAPDLVPHGYLAVDFFFVLSGFVVAHAYEKPLRGSLLFRSFALRRAIRLYPLAVLGTAAGFALLLLKWRSFPEKVDPLPSILISGLLNGLLLPTPFGSELSHHELFPGDGPLWTLCFEFAANLAWGAWGPRLRTRTLLTIVMIAGIAITALSWIAGTANLGFDLATASGGTARVCFGFTLGVVLFRLCGDYAWTEHLRSRKTSPGLVIIFLLTVLAMPRAASPSLFVAWDILSILCIFPFLLVMGASQGRIGHFGEFLGDLSYPIYVVHFPVLLVASGLHQSTLSQVPIALMAAVAIVFSVATAFFSSIFYDVPVRRWIYNLSCRQVNQTERASQG